MRPSQFAGGVAKAVPLSRRAAIAGTVAALAGAARAQQPSPPGQGDDAIWMGRYWAVKQVGDKRVWLALYRKRRGAPGPGEAPRPVLFLVHGSSASALPSFDLSVPGHGEYSMMDGVRPPRLRRLDDGPRRLRRSSRTDGNSDIASGVEDLKAGADLIARETGQASFHMLGESSGALRAGAFAMARPNGWTGWSWKPSPIPARARRPCRPCQAARLLPHA